MFNNTLTDVILIIPQNLAAEKSYNNLDVPVIDALKHRAEVCIAFVWLECYAQCFAQLSLLHKSQNEQRVKSNVTLAENMYLLTFAN